MITLKEAREIAVKITDNITIGINIPQANSLRKWTSKGIISGVNSYDQKGSRGGRVGLYHDTLPIQIAIVSELKGIFGFKITSEATKGIPKYIEKEDLEIEEIVKKVAEEKNYKRGYLNENQRKLDIEDYEDYSNGKIKEEDLSYDERTVIDDIENWMFSNMMDASNYEEVQEAKKPMLEYISNTEKIVILLKYQSWWDFYKKLLEDYYDNN